MQCPFGSHANSYWMAPGMSKVRLLHVGPFVEGCVWFLRRPTKWIKSTSVAGNIMAYGFYIPGRSTNYFTARNSGDSSTHMKAAASTFQRCMGGAGTFSLMPDNVTGIRVVKNWVQNDWVFNTAGMMTVGDRLGRFCQ
jgi:hypothetical protein